jgi:hypothetical protein
LFPKLALGFHTRDSSDIKKAFDQMEGFLKSGNHVVPKKEG